MIWFLENVFPPLFMGLVFLMCGAVFCRGGVRL